MGSFNFFILKRVKDNSYLHVCSTVVEGDTARAWNTTMCYFPLNVEAYMHQGMIYSKGTYWVFVLVSVKPSIHNTTKQILKQEYLRFKCEKVLWAKSQQ